METKPPFQRITKANRSNSFTIKTKKSARSLKPEGEQEYSSAKPDIPSLTSLRSLNEDSTPKHIPEKAFVRPLKRISRTMKITTTPSHETFDLWQRYENKWFEIRTSEIRPLFADIPLPGTCKPIKKVEIADAVEAINEKPVVEPQPRVVLQPLNILQPRYLPQPQYPSTARQSREQVNICQLCSTKNGKSYLSCGHYFCKECLYAYIKTQMDNRAIPIICPKPKCKHELSKHEVTKNMCYTSEINRYFTLVMEVFIEKYPHRLVQCFNTRCSYVFDLAKMKRKDILRCPKCCKSYCVRCHGTAHPGIECEDVPNSKFKVSENDVQSFPAISYRPASHR